MNLIGFWFLNLSKAFSILVNCYFFKTCVIWIFILFSDHATSQLLFESFCCLENSYWTQDSFHAAGELNDIFFLLVGSHPFTRKCIKTTTWTNSNWSRKKEINKINICRAKNWLLPIYFTLRTYIIMVFFVKLHACVLYNTIISIHFIQLAWEQKIHRFCI